MDHMNSTIITPNRERGQHLRFEDRCTIKLCRKLGFSLRKIGGILDCAASTVSNELRRGTGVRNGNRGRFPEYSAKRGQANYEINRTRCHKAHKLEKSAPFIEWVWVITFFKGIYRNSREIWSPVGSVVPLPKSDQKITEEVVAQSGNYIVLYFMCILITWSLLSLYGHDPFNSLFFTMSMQGNVGLEIGQISQTMEWPLKIIGMFNMLSGRLEIYPLLITMRAVFEIFKR